MGDGLVRHQRADGVTSADGFFRSLARGLISFGRPPAPDLAVLPPPVPYDVAVARAAVGHADERSTVTLSNQSLLALVSEVEYRGFITGAICQTQSRGSDAHILVHRRLHGNLPVVGWIMEVEDASGQRRFEFRESIDREAGVPAGTAELYDVHEKRSPNWTLSSLSRVLAIAEAVNFKVAGISQLIYQGKRGAIQLHVPGQEEIGRGEITAHRHEGQTVYCLRIEVGPQRVSGAEM